MASATDSGPGIGLTTIPRAVLSMAAGVMYSVERAVVGDARVRTARGNAWEAMCADRDRARHRDEVNEMVAALAAVSAATATRRVSGSAGTRGAAGRISARTVSAARPAAPAEGAARQPVGVS